MGKEKNPLVKENWSSNFELIGKPKIGDYSYKINERSQKSDWVYNSLSLGIDAGEKHGTVFCEMMGGYASERESVIYAHGKNDDGTDNFSEKIEVPWEERNDDTVLDEIGDRCFIKVALEKTTKGKLVYERFLSAYDAIEYIYNHMSEDMTVKVRGNLSYSTYNDKTQVRKTITSIAVVDDDASGKASFTQTILIDKDSASLKEIDKDKGVMYVNSYVLDYVKEYNGVEVRGNFPYPVQFEYAMDFTKPEQCKKIVDKLFKVKKGITQITFNGEFVESGATVTPTIDDLPDEIKELIDIGVYTEEQALKDCTANGSRERRMVLLNPHIKLVGDDKQPVIQVFAEKFDEDDLILECMTKVDDEPPFDEDTDSTSDDDDMSWLDNL